MSTDNKQELSVKDEFIKVSMKLVFWMALISFVIGVGMPMLGDVIAEMYANLKDYFIEADVAEQTALGFLGIF